MNDENGRSADKKKLQTSIQKLENSILERNVRESDELDMGEVWRAIYSGRWLIFIITSVISISSIVYALWVPDEYKSTVILAPSSSSGAPLSKLAGKFGGLASLAGINLGGGGADNKAEIAIELIKTWGFLEKFIDDNQIAIEIFAAERWDRASNRIIIDSEIYDTENDTWVRDFDAGKGEEAKPNGWELYEEFSDRVTISQDKMTGLVRLSVEYYSPILAKQWTDKLLQAINRHIQLQDKREATRTIQYLEEKARETTVSEMRAVFYELIEEQTKTLMLAEVSEEYVFKTLSPAKIAKEKSKPIRALIVILGSLVGGIFALLIAIIRHFVEQKRQLGSGY